MIIWLFWCATGCQTGAETNDKGRLNTATHLSAPSLTTAMPVGAGAQADQDRLANCIRTIDLNQDELHAEMTPAVWCLIEIGPPAIPPLLELLDAPDVGTRLRAVTALRAISRTHFGFDGKQWTDDGEGRWLDWWVGVSYDFRAPAAARVASIRKMRERFAPATNQAVP